MVSGGIFEEVAPIWKMMLIDDWLVLQDSVKLVQHGTSKRESSVLICKVENATLY